MATGLKSRYERRVDIGYDQEALRRSYRGR